MRRLAPRAAALIGLAALLLVAVPGRAQVNRIPVKPDQGTSLADEWRPGRASARACIDASRIGGAIVVDPRTVDIIMRGGKRWRLTLAQQCPQLSYYGGFYYKAGRAGEICAGRDHVIGRAGGSCQVSRLAPLERVPQRR